MGKYLLVDSYSSISLLWKDIDAKSVSDTLHDLVPFIQVKKCEKHTWRSVNISKVVGLLY